MKIGPFTVTRGSILPYEIWVTTPQSVKKASDGSVTVVEKPYTRELYLKVKIKVDKDEADQIESFITYGASFRRQTWTFQDGYGVDFTVRYWDDEIRKRVIRASNIVELSLLLRVEV